MMGHEHKRETVCGGGRGWRGGEKERLNMIKVCYIMYEDGIMKPTKYCLKRGMLESIMEG
jgi:hypothetical protein